MVSADWLDVALVALEVLEAPEDSIMAALELEELVEPVD